LSSLSGAALLSSLTAACQQRIEFAIHGDVEMRDRLLGFLQAAGNGLAHAVVLDQLVGAFGEVLQHSLVGHALWRRRSRLRPAVRQRSGGALPVPAAMAASTSFLTIRPCGPEPEICRHIDPASLAMRRASGDENDALSR
jgi:hypothetical protein